MIVWGTYVRRQRLGRVADFCKICRDMTAFRLTRVKQIGHLYFVPLSFGKTIGHFRRCEECGVPYDAHPAEYESVQRSRTGDIVELATATHPQLGEKYAARFELEDRVMSGRLTAEERRALILEPLVLLDPLVETRCANSHIDIRTAITAVISIALFSTMILWADASTGEMREWLFPAAWTIGGVVLLLTMLTWAGDVRRYIRREIHPKLIRALRSLNPSQAELSEVLGRLKASKVKSGRKVRAKELYEALRRDAGELA